MLSRKNHAGFTLIEMMVVLAIISIMLFYAVPGYQEWIARARARSAAESLQNALRVAQGSAIQKSRRVAFSLTNNPLALNAVPVTNGTSWFSQTLPLIATEAAGVGRFLGGDTVARNTGVTITGPDSICFNSSGRLVALTTTTPAPDNITITCALPVAANGVIAYNLQAGAVAASALRVEVFLGGRIRMSNPAITLDATHPEGFTPP